MLNVGEKAPDFTAATDEGTAFRLADWLGKKHVVMYFYPKDFTAGCTREACAFRDNYAAITQEDAVIVGVSTDDIDSHRKFREKYALPFPLLADSENRVTALYDAQRRFILPGAQRVTYVIDKVGVIQGAFRHELAIGRHQDDVLLTLRRLNETPAHPGPDSP